MKPLVLSFLLAASPLYAGPAEVVGVKATEQGGSWRFDVTVAHADTGWEHYADGWRVFTPDGVEVGYRELLHPHVEEQPFTRSQSGIVIPEGVSEVTVQAFDNVDGAGPPVTFALPGR
ncbi:MAG: hypothetical protein AAGE38_08060 [Pseudomonadota bacterium]